jgi:hypothetical protein
MRRWSGITTVSVEPTTDPHDLEAERALLGAVLIAPTAFEAAATVVQASDFYRAAHQRVFAAMAAVVRDGRPVDFVTLKDALVRSGELDTVGGPAYLASLTDGVPKTTNVAHYGRIVRDHAHTREALDRCRRADALLRTGRRAAAMDLLREVPDVTTDDDDLLIEPLVTVAARITAAPAAMLIDGLLPAVGNTLNFGLERTFKSLLARALAVAVAGGSGPYALGLPRLRVSEPAPVIYITEEDHEGAVWEHLDAFADGHAAELPIYLSACRGLSLDDPTTQDRLIRQSLMTGAKLIVVEPLRSLTSCVDRTPGELHPFAQFIRRWTRETGAAFLLGHHAVKPQAGADGRRGAQRISGGGLFSICESPIESRRLDDERVCLTPLSWKHSAAPPPLVLRLDTAHGRVRRLVAEEHAPDAIAESPDAETAARLIEAIRAHPGMSATAATKAAAVQKQHGLVVIDQLAQAGQLQREGPPHRGRWYAT